MHPDIPLDRRVTLNPDEDAITRTVLLILRTIAGVGGGAHGVWRVFPEERVFSDSAMMEYLRRTPKPLVCEVLQATEPTVIKCGPPETEDEWRWWAKSRHTPASILSPVVQMEMYRTGNRRVLIAGDTESIVLSDVQLKVLERDYIIVGNYTVATFLASQISPVLDVAIVCRYWRSTNSTHVKIM
jgi:hypothetical protein